MWQEGGGGKSPAVGMEDGMKVLNEFEDGNQVRAYGDNEIVISVEDEDWEGISLSRDEAIAAARAILKHFEVE